MLQTGKQGGPTFQDIAEKLPQAKLKRLAELKKAYPHIPLEKLPDAVRREVQDILQIANSPLTPDQKDYSKLESIIGEDLRGSKDIAITQEARRQGMYIIGTTGTGKSTLLANLILTDIKQGLGVCLIEPHGDLTNTVLAGIPDKRLSNIIYLDMTDSEYPFGLNLFQCSEPRTIDAMSKTASFVHHVFEKLWGVGTDTPRLMQVLRALTRTLMENPGTTFAEIPLLFSRDSVRAKMVANLTNSSIVSFWEDYNGKSPRLREEYIESTKNKIMSFLDEPMVRNIVAQSETTIDCRHIMDSRKILLVKLSPQFKEVSLLIGAIIIGKLLMAAWSREDMEEDKRRQFNLYCDEYQRFATSDLRSFIDEARKFRVAITLSHQNLSQLDEENRNAATGAANMIVFRVTGEDGKELAKNFDTTPTQEIVGEEPIRAPVSDVIDHLVKRGHADERVTQFAQIYLQRLEDFVSKPKQNGVVLSYTGICYTDQNIRKGREVLNEAFYRCMITRSSQFVIQPIALCILAVARWDRSEEAFLPYIKTTWLSPRYIQDFLKGVEKFGDPDFVNNDVSTEFIASHRKKDKQAAIAAVNMIREFRHTMKVLAEYPILVDTGQYKQKYQDRTYIDMENEIARNLTQQPNYQAKVKLLSGEYDIRTKDMPRDMVGNELTERIKQVKKQMRVCGYCRYYKDVEKEINERMKRWKVRKSDEPPPTHT
jgi:hypothetical protein